MIINSLSKGNLTAKQYNSNVAGLVVYNQSTASIPSYIKDCYSISNIDQIAIGRASLVYRNIETNSISNLKFLYFSFKGSRIPTRNSSS